MGLFDALMGNVSSVDPKEIYEELQPILGDDEQLVLAYKMVRDLFLFTNKRLMLIDKQGLTGKKVSYRTIPYRAITHFEVETAGNFDMDAELKIYISGCAEPIATELKRGSDIVALQKALANFAVK